MHFSPSNSTRWTVLRKRSLSSVQFLDILSNIRFLDFHLEVSLTYPIKNFCCWEFLKNRDFKFFLERKN